MPAFKRSILFVILAATLPAVVQADFRAYARGQEAAADGRWSEVETDMQQALAENAQPKARVRLYGQRFAPYVPQYYLGLAAYRQGDCQSALRWFGESAAAAVIGQVGEFKSVADAARADCNTKLAAKPAGGTDKPATTRPEVSKPLVTPAEVPRTASSTASKPTTVTSTPTIPSRAQSTVSNASPAASSNLPASTIPGALQSALTQWLAGRNREVAAGSVAGLQGRALAHLHLLRAAAAFSQSEIEVANATGLRAQATQEVRKARLAFPAINPDPGFFSPRFRTFFAATR